MNAAIEFHDSKVASIRVVEGEVHLEFRSAVIHRSSGQPGIDSGSVFLQPVEVVFSNGVPTESGGPCIGALSDGSIRVDGREYSNVVPLPFESHGAVEGAFTFSSGAILEVTGTAVSCRASGEAVFLEAYWRDR